MEDKESRSSMSIRDNVLPRLFFTVWTFRVFIKISRNMLRDLQFRLVKASLGSVSLSITPVWKFIRPLIKFLIELEAWLTNLNSVGSHWELIGVVGAILELQEKFLLARIVGSGVFSETIFLHFFVILFFY